MTTSLQSHTQSTAVLAYSVNNKKYERNIKKVLSKIALDKNIASLHICLACTLQVWNKIIEGRDYKEGLAIAKSDGDNIELQLDKYAKNILGDKYKGIIRWHNCINHNNYLNERSKFDTLCVKDSTLHLLNSLIKYSSREDLLRNEHDVGEIFKELLQGKKWAEIPWETAMAASIFDYVIAFIKKHDPKNNPNIYYDKSFGDLLNIIFCNSYEYLAEEAVIAYKFWNYNKLLYFGKITPILSKAYEEFVLKSGSQNRLWWQNLEAVDPEDLNALVKNHIDIYLKNQKVQVRKECLLEFTNLVTSLLRLINGVTSKEIRHSLKLLATSLIVSHEQKTQGDES